MQASQKYSRAVCEACGREMAGTTQTTQCAPCRLGWDATVLIMASREAEARRQQERFALTVN